MGVAPPALLVYDQSEKAGEITEHLPNCALNNGCVLMCLKPLLVEVWFKNTPICLFVRVALTLSDWNKHIIWTGNVATQESGSE